MLIKLSIMLIPNTILVYKFLFIITYINTLG